MKRMILSLALGLILSILVLLLVSVPIGRAAPDIIYVDHDAPGSNNGSSWLNAFTTLSPALAQANAGDEIWVAAGVYIPTDTITRTATFHLKDGVTLYGGFAGGNNNEGMDDRDWQTNVTVLSGDLDNNDAADIVDDINDIVGNNAYHVVTADGVTNTAILDGFTITAGNANGSNRTQRLGGGMYSVGSSPQLLNVTFSGNRADGAGGGMYSEGNPTLTNVAFSNNQAWLSGGLSGAGGGMLSKGNPTLTHVTFTNNKATWGGGMENDQDSKPTLTNATFTGNQSESHGGGMHNIYSTPTLTEVTFIDNQAGTGGGIFNFESSPTLMNITFRGNQAGLGGGMCDYGNSIPTLTNATFRGNQAGQGGGLYHDSQGITLTNAIFSGNYAESDGGGMYNGPYSNSTLTNITFSGNQAASRGGGIYNMNSRLALTNCILWGNGADNNTEIYNAYNAIPKITYSDIQGSEPVSGTIDTNPMFVNPIAATSAPTITGDYHLQAGSLAIDAGDPDFNDPVGVDRDRNPRIVDGNGDGIYRVDMGAYEFQTTSTVHSLTVMLTGSGSGSVNSVPTGIACPGDCSQVYPSGSVVTLTAMPLNPSIFVGWSGACNSTVPTCLVTLDVNQSVTASFSSTINLNFRLYLPFALRDLP